MTTKNNMLKHLHIQPSGGVSRPATSTPNKRWFFMQPKQSKAEALPDPNPVKTTRDHLGNVTKMAYRVMPSGPILAHVEIDTNE